MSRPTRSTLTTTSYAILGLLAARPRWSAYELTKYARRSFHLFWPRALRNLFHEPKRLVEHGFATAEPQRLGKRPRTVYSITPKGRQALRRWLGEPSSPPLFESEALVRVLFADQGGKQDVLAAIHSIGEWAEAQRRASAELCRDYLATGGPFPERLHIIALLVKVLVGYQRMLGDWAQWAEREVAAWPATKATDATRVATEVFEEALQMTSRRDPAPSPRIQSPRRVPD